MIHPKNNYQHQKARRLKNRQRILAHAQNPILIVFRSAKHISVQILDLSGKVLVSASDFEIKKAKGNKTVQAGLVGELIAQKAKSASGGKISSVAFDRGQYRYHGRVKALAEAARKGGLKF